MGIEDKFERRALMMVDPGDGFPGMRGMALDIKLNFDIVTRQPGRRSQARSLRGGRLNGQKPRQDRKISVPQILAAARYCSHRHHGAEP